LSTKGTEICLLEEFLHLYLLGPEKENITKGHFYVKTSRERSLVTNIGCNMERLSNNHSENAAPYWSYVLSNFEYLIGLDANLFHILTQYFYGQVCILFA
jgi:hypothetical protein